MVIHRGYLGMINHSFEAAYMPRYVQITVTHYLLHTSGDEAGFSCRAMRRTLSQVHTLSPRQQHTNTRFKYNVQTVNDKSWQSVTDMKHRC